MTLAIKPTARALRLLKRARSKSVRLTITFAPSAASAVQTNKTITLKRPAKKRH